MHSTSPIIDKPRLATLLAAVALGTLSGCSVGGPSVEARPQAIGFQAAPTLVPGGSATVAATASSGLPVSYSSTTPAVCSVDSGTGVVSALAPGTCVIVANQAGDTRFAPAPQATQSIPVLGSRDQAISFGLAPTLSLGGTANVAATASSGLSVRYGSLTPAVCRVDSGSGLISDLTTGECIVAADQAGDASFNPAPQVTQTLTVSLPSTVSVPGAPTGVTATAGDSLRSVSVSISATDSGGSPITGYTVTSVPAGISATGAASPVTVTCPSGCGGYAFSASATNAIGSGAPSAPAQVNTAYDITATFQEPDTQPRNTVFVGSFTFNSTTGAVSDLGGILTESMTGGPIAFPNDTMTRLSLSHQLSSVNDPALGGLLVTTFLLSGTGTFSNNPAFGGTDGWTPGTGSGLYFGFPGGSNPGNAYARIFINSTEPTAPLSQAQIDKMAYADCTPGGMMGATCMTGTTVAGYGTVGSMSGFPLSQAITKK
jgi:hypothetical protein